MKKLVIDYTVGNHVIFYTCSQTKRIRIFVIISLMLNEFSYSKVQIPHGFVASRYLRGVSMHAVVFHTNWSKDRKSLLKVV